MINRVKRVRRKRIEMKLLFVFQPGSRLSSFKPKEKTHGNRRPVFVHYNQKLPETGRVVRLYPSEAMHFKESAFTQALELISNSEYHPENHLALFNQLNPNILLSFYGLADPKKLMLIGRRALKQLRDASIYCETLSGNKEKTRLLHFGLFGLIRSASEELCPPTEKIKPRQMLELVNSLVYGKHKKRLEALLENPRHGGYADAYSDYIRSCMQKLEKAKRSDHEVTLVHGGRVRVTAFEGDAYAHPLAGYGLASDSDIVIRKSTRRNAYWEIGVQPSLTDSISITPSFYKGLAEMERKNWRKSGSDLAKLEADLPGGRVNTGGTSRREDTQLTKQQILELIKRHVTLDKEKGSEK